MLKYRLAIAALLISSPAYAKSDDGCDTYPKEVGTGYSDCILRDVGERALWHGPRRGIMQEIRFTFTEGYLRYTKIIHVTQRANGNASIRFRTLRRDHNGDLIVTGNRSRRLSAKDMAKIDELGSFSGTWEHRTGSWDADEVFIHCETLEMERATTRGYSFASINISCNQPERLMPFVRFVTELVGLKSYTDR